MIKTLPKSCPGCMAELKVKSLQCPECDTSIDGKFDLPLLALLDAKDQEFIVSFIKHSGSLKKMAKELDLSYPTVRNMLNDLISRINNLQNIKES